MAVTERDSRCRWKDGKEQELLAFVDDRIRGGATVTSALKEYGERHGMSWLTARWKYYQMKRRASRVSVVPEKTPEPDFRGRVAPEETLHPYPGGTGNSKDASLARDQGDFLGSLSSLIRASGEVGEDVVSLIRGLSRMAELAKNALEAKELLLQARMKEVQLAEEAEKVRTVILESLNDLREFNEFIDGWLETPPVDRVAGLSDFTSRLEAGRNTLAEIIRRLSGVAKTS